MDDFESVWHRIVIHAGEEFEQFEGGKFTYEVNGNVLNPSRTNQNLSKGQFEEAWDRMPVEGPGALQDLQGPSYLFAILTDPRIWTELTTPEFSFKCPKCGGTWCSFSEIRGPSGAVTAYLDLDVAAFTAVSCRNCRFTEFYVGYLGSFRSHYGLTENEWSAEGN